MSSSTSSSPASTPLATPEGSIYAATDGSGSFSSFLRHPASPPTPAAPSTVYDDDDDDDRDSMTDEAEEEWQESLQQLELLMSMVVIPFFGKWVGRRCAYWLWTKAMAWKYPGEVVQTVVKDSVTFYGAGVIGTVAASPVVSPPI